MRDTKAEADSPEGLLLIGSTGSIGESTLKVVRANPARFRVRGLSANRSWERLVEQAFEFKPGFVHVSDAAYVETRTALKGSGVEVLAGRETLSELPEREGLDVLMLAIVGTRGLQPMLTGIRRGLRICFANKEPLVTAGEPVMREVRRHGVPFIPVDSEHSAILQCLRGEDPEDLRRIWLTASGGPFREWSREEVHAATREEALKHPTWNMGAKITVDSATMMNKALELIEARWLYGLPQERIEVLIHPQSIIHSMVEFRDRSVKAQLGLPDMRIPIQFALTYPRHLPLEMESPDWTTLASLEFAEPDERKFPSLGLAREAMRRGGGYPCVLNAANEAAVELFLAGGMPVSEIFRLVEDELDSYTGEDHELDELIALDARVRERVLCAV